jgi:hypothetical protein
MDTYKVFYEEHQSWIEPCEDPPDGVEVFVNFTSAQQALVRYLRNQRDLFRFALQEAKRLKRRDVTDG